MTAKNWATLAILSILWGGSFLFIEVALTGFPVLTIVWARVAGAAAVLGLWLAVGGAGFPNGQQAWAALLVMGILNNVLPFTLFVLAQGQITAGLASILNATTPLWTVIVAHQFTRDERLSASKAAGLLLGFLGVSVIAGGDTAGHFGAILACLGAAVSYGFAGVWGRRFKAMGLAPMQVAFGMLTSSSLLVFPFWMGIDRPWQADSPALAPVLALAALAVLSTALAYVLYFRLLARAGATMLSLVTLLIPASALGLGALVLQEAILLHHLFGLALILLGLLAIDGRLSKWRG
jgi:drug/metabolite transporter (DMT)-like permease